MKKVFYFDMKAEHWQEEPCQASVSEATMKRLVKTRKDRFFIPYRWTVEAKGDSIVNVALDIFMVSFSEGKLQSVQEKEWLIECDFAHSKMKAWPIAFLRERTNGWVTSFHCPEGITFPDMAGASHVEIPSVVTETALSFLQEFAEREFGFRPTYMGRIHGLNHMIAFCHRPLDMNIYLLRHVIGESYERLFPREQRDNYRPLCRFFHIERPPKSLRRAYGECAENMVVYVLLHQMGFRDINIIRRFFHRDVLFGYRLLNLTYYSAMGILVDASGQYANPYLEWMERFCHWYLRHRGESCLANCLRPLAAVEEWNQDAIDILRMFVIANLDRDEAQLSRDTLRHLLREGFTHAVHDEMMHDLMNVLPLREHGRVIWNDIPNMTINYTDMEKEYADEMDGYRFLLPKDTDEIRRYGKAFHNCVASYRIAVLENRSLILAMVQGEKYIACIEVQQHRVVQALGPCNQRLSPKVHEVLRNWAEKKKIVYGVRH